MEETKLQDDKEKLGDLPPRENKIPSEREQTVLDRYFPQNDKKMVFWKVLLIATVSYLLLCNPLINRVFDAIPYCSGFIGLFVKTGLYAVLFSIGFYLS